jgi:hypothetical protein
MITLSIDASVLIALKKAMPKTNKAELALEKYKEVLKQLIGNLAAVYANTGMMLAYIRLQFGLVFVTKLF